MSKIELNMRKQIGQVFVDGIDLSNVVTRAEIVAQSGQLPKVVLEVLCTELSVNLDGVELEYVPKHICNLGLSTREGGDCTIEPLNPPRAPEDSDICSKR